MTYITIDVDTQLKEKLQKLMDKYQSRVQKATADAQTAESSATDLTEDENFVTITHSENNRTYRLTFVCDGREIKVTPVYLYPNNSNTTDPGTTSL